MSISAEKEKEFVDYSMKVLTRKRTIESAVKAYCEGNKMNKKQQIQQLLNNATKDTVDKIFELLEIDEVPEGFESGDSIKDIPLGCLGLIKYKNWDSIVRGELNKFNPLSRPQMLALPIEYYKVTHVPTLTLEEADELGEFWYFDKFASPCRVDISVTYYPFDFFCIGSGCAYRTREHAETAKKWGLLNPIYDRVLK